MSEIWDALSFQAGPVSHQFINAVHGVATGEIPAIIVRGAHPKENCRQLLHRLFERKLFVGYERYGRGREDQSEIERFDLGTSHGNLGND